MSAGGDGSETGISAGHGASDSADGIGISGEVGRQNRRLLGIAFRHRKQTKGPRPPFPIHLRSRRPHHKCDASAFFHLDRY